MKNLATISRIAVAWIFVVLLPPGAMAQSANSYQYDALGRLALVQTGEGVKSTYAFDRASNRSNVTTNRQFDHYWEAESQYHQTGFADADGWAANVNSATGALVYGPYSSTIPTGSRVATWRMLIDNNDPTQNAPIVYIDVNDATTSEVLASKIIDRTSWNSSNNYEIFELPFIMDASRAGHFMEIRTFYVGNAYVRVDKIGYY